MRFCACHKQPIRQAPMHFHCPQQSTNITFLNALPAIVQGTITACCDTLSPLAARCTSGKPWYTFAVSRKAPAQHSRKCSSNCRKALSQSASRHYRCVSMVTMAILNRGNFTYGSLVWPPKKCHATKMSCKENDM